MLTTELLLSTTTYGEPSGNYDGSSLEWFGDAVKAADYYRGRGGLQTVLFTLTNAEVSITVQATLDSDPNSATWFDTITYDNLTPNTVANYPVNITGNFTWLRVKIVNFASGIINSVTVTY
jgi:hypothetical protein